MPGVQALDLPRTVAFAIWPHEVDLVTDPKDPYFDRRVFDEIDRGVLVSVARHGYQHNIKIVQVDGRHIPVFGKGRTKIGLVINHLAAVHPYEGDLKPVLDCIAELKGGIVHDLILQHVGEKGVRMMATPMPAAGGALKAQRLMAVENTHRRAESDAQRAERAQRLLELGVPEVEIMEDLDIKTKATLHRLLKFDPDAPPATPKTRTKSTRPTKNRIAAIADEAVKAFPETAPALIILNFVCGRITEEEFFKDFPTLKPKAKSKKAA